MYKLNKLFYKNLINLLGLITYKVSLDLIYYKIIGPNFDYVGYENSYSLTKLILSYLVILIMFPLINRLYRDYKHIIFSYVVLFCILLSFIPNLTYICFNEVKSFYILLFILYWITFFSAAKVLPSIKSTYVRFKNPEFPIYLYLLVLGASVLFISAIYTGFRLHFNLMDVYDLRGEAKEYGYPSIFGYILPAAGSLLPLLFLYFMDKKKMWIAICIIFMVLLNFGIAGHKTVLVSLIITILFYFIYNNNIIRYVTWLLSGIGFIGLLEYLVGGSYIFSSLVYRRVMFAPALLNYNYFDFFIHNEPDYFRRSFLRIIGSKSPYEYPISNIIGDLYISPGCNANNGLFSDAISNFGPCGVIVFPFIVIFLIKLIDSFTRGIPNKLLVIPAMMISLSLISTALMTSLFTGGLVLTALFFYSYPRSHKYKGILK